MTTKTVHPEDVEGILTKWRACLATGEIFEHETRVRRANGEYRWMFHRKVPLRDANGNIVKWYGLSLDIEERKTAEEALRSSEAYLAEMNSLLEKEGMAGQVQMVYLHILNLIRPGYEAKNWDSHSEY
jgi:PAS domain-containing protein